MINIVMPLLKKHNVILLCDSWYSKGKILETVKKYSNLNIIGAIRSDTALFDLPPAPTGKRGRPRKRGSKLDYKVFSYTKVGKYYIATLKVITRLFDKPVYITVTTTDTESFSSVRMYLSTENPENLNIYSYEEFSDYKYPKSESKAASINIYSFRWNIEVIFYQQKFFWSFGNYMVRSKTAIERYINLTAISFTFVSVLPFIKGTFSNYKFESSQVIKRLVSERILKELIFDSFVSTLENSKIYSIVSKYVHYFIYHNNAA